MHSGRGGPVGVLLCRVPAEGAGSANTSHRERQADKLAWSAPLIHSDMHTNIGKKRGRMQKYLECPSGFLVWDTGFPR